MFRASLPRTAGLAVALTAVAGLTACGSSSPTTTGSTTGSTTAATTSATNPATPHATPAAVLGADGGPLRTVDGTGALSSGFVVPTAPPTPGGTLTPSAGSWAAVHTPVGYSVVLVTSAEDRDTVRLGRIVRSWAHENDVRITVLRARRESAHLRVIQHAIDLAPDLVVSVGTRLADPLAVVTPNWADQKFLLLGAELAEPTHNVTAAIWQDGSFRGGASTVSASYDPTLFTRARVNRALTAGVAAVLRGYPGFVVKVD